MVDQTITSVITAEQVTEREAEEEFAREIVGGEWDSEIDTFGQLQALIAIRMMIILDTFVEAHQLGEVFPPNLTYILEGTPEKIVTLRVPDVTFIREDNLDRANTGYIYHAPDLAVEILLPDERPGYMMRKIADYLRFGTQQVWVIDPKEKNIAAHFPDGRVKVYEQDETLPGGDILPDFALKVADVFAE